MTMPGLAANRRPRVVAPRSPRITYSGFYKGGLGASIDLSNLTVVGLYTRNGFVTTVRLLY